MGIVLEIGIIVMHAISFDEMVEDMSLWKQT